MTNMSSQRALSADAVGNAYVVTLLDTSEVQLDRPPFGTTTFAAPRNLASSASYPGIAALPTSNGAAVIYQDAAGIWATVRVY